MDEAKLMGGPPDDQRRLLERMDEYLDANARFDWEKLQDIWSATAEAVFFNLDGHTYKGREHWTRLWRYYRDNAASGYWTPFNELVLTFAGAQPLDDIAYLGRAFCEP
jgi:SnoaL-like domain